MRALLDLVLPPHCPGCGYEGEVLCDTCWRPLERRLAEPSGYPLGMPVSMPDGLVQLEWCGPYSGSVRSAIHALKYRAERRLVEPLAGVLAQRWARSGAGGELITWVPVHPTRRRERGFDQAEVLARAMAGMLDLPVLATLERRRRTLAQHALDQRQRADNVGGVFAVTASAAAGLHGRWVIVVDDVVTTGSTLSGCAQALLAGGATGVSAITVARDR